MESSNKKRRLKKRVDEKNEMKNSIDTSESVDNDDDYGYTVKDLISINHDIMITTTNKRKQRNSGVDKNNIKNDANCGDDDDDNQCIRVSHPLCIIRYVW